MDMDQDLGLLQLSDSFFPTGLYSTSSGLEALAAEEDVSDMRLYRFIATQIEQQLGPCDCVALMNAVDLKSALDIDRTISAMKYVREVREASRSSGIQLLKIVQRLSKDGTLSGFLEAAGRGATPCMYPVAFGVCTHALKIDVRRAAMSFLYGFVVSVVGAALRLGIIQHIRGQEIIYELKPAIIDAVRASHGTPASEMWQFAPHLDICQMRHERMDMKMFIT